MTDPAQIVVACDGSALVNPGPAGWAWYIDDDCWAAGGEPHATNNAMELMAVLRFLEAVAHVPHEPTLIRCDSQYVINGLTTWWRGWVRKDWKNAKGEAVKNPELFQANLTLLAERTATRFEWVKGHNGDALNDAADVRANGAATAIKHRTPVATGPGWSHTQLVPPAVELPEFEDF